MLKTKKIASLTLGCKVNSYDTAAMLSQFSSKGYTIEEDFDAVADVYLINTCTITNLGDKKSRQMIRRARANNPSALVVAAGCYAQVAPKDVAAIEGVNIVIGNKDRTNIVNVVESYTGNQTHIYNADLRYEKIFEELKLESAGTKTRAFVKIQEGCDQFCSYCIIPYARGRSRSRDITNIVSEVELLCKKGYKEVVLTGIHVASYGKDLQNTSLADVIKEVHQISGVERIRLSSIEPGAATESFVSEISKLPKVCDHFHLSLQSGSNKILAAMSRKYRTGDFFRAVAMLRKSMPKVSITTDVIVGFPGESDKDFAETVSFVESIGFAGIHIFPFSAKKGTKAHGFGEQVSPQTKNHRAKVLKEVEERQRKQFVVDNVGEKLKVLYETKIDNETYEGYSTNYIKVRSQSVKCLKNQILEVAVEKEENGYAIGSIG
ncbi:MAG: tRNA (N(6)-L-threonylcarbamoyladenosine(37)-C(2))-methylthiotransferase MtaB [Defluviitaleaceae bacterium]|nr:tRNA (N(6)-L-threonylcarbamoyladenosine(37)-C(2))-methylthiotransferase MtaB [Defluviitaleaceae bacterium]